jgi:hypothetical protein
MEDRSPWLAPHRFKSGSAWTGNAGGRPKGFTALLKELMSKRELCGQPTPGDRTVEECLVEAFVSHAIKGSPSHMAEIWARLEGRVGEAAIQEAMSRTIYEIVSNNRDRLEPQPNGQPGNDGKPGEVEKPPEQPGDEQQPL